MFVACKQALAFNAEERKQTSSVLQTRFHARSMLCIQLFTTNLTMRSHGQVLKHDLMAVVSNDIYKVFKDTFSEPCQHRHHGNRLTSPNRSTGHVCGDKIFDERHKKLSPLRRNPLTRHARPLHLHFNRQTMHKYFSQTCIKLSFW